MPNLQQFLGSIGVRVPRQSPAFNRLASRFQQTEIEVYDALLQRRQGVAVPIRVAPPDPMRLREVLDCWRSRSSARDPKTVRAFEQAFELFAAHGRVVTARLIRKPDAVAFRNALLADGKHSAVTISKLLSLLRAAFRAAVDDGLLELNPFDGVRVVAQETASVDKSRLPFTVEQLNRIFTGPIYRPDAVPRPSLGTACRWLPLLALFQGARLEELAQLETTDIGKDPTLGYFLRITSAGDRRLKTASSRRDIPVHPMRVELAFIDYVGKCKPGRLFPALRKDKHGRLGTRYSTWFGRSMDDLGLVDPQLVFNPFRHSFIEECKSKVHEGVPSEVREAIVGHLSPKQIEMTYGKAVYPWMQSACSCCCRTASRSFCRTWLSRAATFATACHDMGQDALRGFLAGWQSACSSDGVSYRPYGIRSVEQIGAAARGENIFEAEGDDGGGLRRRVACVAVSVRDR